MEKYGVIKGQDICLVCKGEGELPKGTKGKQICMACNGTGQIKRSGRTNSK